MQTTPATETKNALRLVQISPEYAESYDVFDGDRQVGYLYMRHGDFTVRCPDVSGHLVYEAHPEGYGSFEEHERHYYLRFAVDAIHRWMRGEFVAKPPPPDVGYVLEPLLD